jgi:hypothetical protein
MQQRLKRLGQIKGNPGLPGWGSDARILNSLQKIIQIKKPNNEHQIKEKGH